MPKPSHPSDPLRSQLLEQCEELLRRSQAMRNFAMKPGNAWLARGELATIQNITNDIDSLLEEIKRTDEIA